MQPPKELHDKEPSPAVIVRVNRTEPLVRHIVFDSQAIAMNGEHNTTENMSLTHPNGHGGNANGLSTTFAIPIAPQMEAEENSDEAFEDGDSLDSATNSPESLEEETLEDYFDDSAWIWAHPPLEDQRPIDPMNRTAVFVSLSRDISYAMTAIRAMWTYMEQHYLTPQSLNSPEVDFYSRFALALCCRGFEAADRGLYWLRLKARAHGYYLRHVNEVLALDPHSDPAYLQLRIWNTNERANLIAAIDLLQDCVDQYLQQVPTTVPNDDLVQGNLGNNHSIDIIDPATGLPIVITNGVNHDNVGDLESGLPVVLTNGVNHDNVGDPAYDSQAGTDAMNMTYDGANDFLPTSVRHNSPRPDSAASRSTRNVHDAFSIAKEDDDDAITWVHQEVWTEPLHSPGRPRVGDTVPRGFGGSPHRYRLALCSYSELDQGDSGLDSLSTSGIAGSQRSDLSTVNSM